MRNYDLDKQMEIDEQKYIERQKSLEEKNRQRKARRNHRMKRRKKHEFKILSIILRLSVVGLIILFLVGTYKSVEHIVAEYHKTLSWEKSDQTKLSEIPPELLYKSDTERANTLKYIRLQSDIYDTDKHDFKRGVTKGEISTLEKLYALLDKDTQTLFKDIYDEIHVNYDIDRDYYKIVKRNDEKTIQTTTTIDEVQSYITTHAESVVNQLNKPGDHEFAKKKYDQMWKLVEDISKMDSLYDNLDSAYSIKSTKDSLNATVNNQAEKSWLANLFSYREELNYKWSVINTVIQPLFNNSDKILLAHEQSRVDYEKYEQDLKDEQSFKNYQDSYTSAVQTLESRIIDLPDLTKMNRGQLEKWSKDNGIKLKLTKEDTTDKSKENTLEVDIDFNQHKRILKGTTIDIKEYNYKAPVEEPETRPTPERTPQDPETDDETEKEEEPDTDADKDKDTDKEEKEETETDDDESEVEEDDTETE